jgi:hypothetical protein
LPQITNRFMRVFLLFLAISSGIAFNGCKCCRKHKTENATATTQEGNSQSTPVKANQDGPKYDLIVSFISIGAGTDSKGKQQLNDFIANFQNDKKVTLKYEDFAWGREGEEDFCFTFNNLSAELKEKFVVNVKDMFLNNTLVRVGENEYFVHKRK